MTFLCHLGDSMSMEKKKKVKEALDEPGITTEKGVKINWGAVKKFEKEVKDKVTKEKEEKKEIRTTLKGT